MAFRIKTKMFLYEKEMKKYTGFIEQSSAAPNIKGKVNESFTHRVSHVERDTQGCVCKGGTTHGHTFSCTGLASEN